MPSISNFLGLLQQYTGANAANPPANAQQDFQQVSQAAPQEHLATGLAEAFRSNQTPPFPEMLASLFGQSNGQQRAGILNQLVAAAGPALAGGTAGGIAGQLAGLLKGGANVTPQQAEQVSPEAVQQLATQAQAHNPSIIDLASNFYAQHPQLVQGLGAGALALIMSHMSKKI
jgi:hypothetical protein